MEQCRIIFTCESLSRVIRPLKSRCVNVRVPSPREDIITKRLNTIIDKEEVEVKPQLLKVIAKKSKRNMRKAIMMLQLYVTDMIGGIKKSDPFTLEYEKVLKNIVADMKQEQSPKMLMDVRKKFYLLITKSISDEAIL